MSTLLKNDQFQNVLQEIADKEGREISEVHEIANDYLQELYSVRHPLSNVASMKIVEYLLGRGFDKEIDIEIEDLRKLSRLMYKHPVAFVITHKTYIDLLVLNYVLAQHGLPTPFIFAGINLKLPMVANLAQNSGVIFIRRNIKSNNIYKATLKHYISTLVQENAGFVWAIEGTRSRTGKLVWPKMGILKYILDAEQAAEKEVKYVPVSISYDLIPDVKVMTEEAKGKSKQAENLEWLAGYVKKLSTKLGRIAVRIGDPVDLTDERQSFKIEETVGEKPVISSVPRLAFELVHSINQITPVTTTSLVCVTLLSKFALSKKELELHVNTLMQYIGRTQGNVLVDRGKPIGESVQKALNLLLKDDLVLLSGEGKYVQYQINKENYLESSYYANTCIHHLYHRAFSELALLHIHNEKPVNASLEYWKMVMKVRDVFKFEFFYSNKLKFTEEIEDDLSMITKDWETIIKKNSGRSILDLLEKRRLLVAPVVLAVYVEAYMVVAHALKKWDGKKEFDEHEFFQICARQGEEMEWNGSIRRMEAASKPFMINGIRLARNRGLIPEKKNNKHKEIDAFLIELEAMSDSIRVLREMTVHKTVSKDKIPLAQRFVPGSKTEAIVSEIMETEKGPEIAALFDLDRTLIRSYSATEFAKTRMTSGKMTTQELINQFAGIIVYAAGNKNFAGFMSVGTQGLKGIKESQFVKMGEEVYLNTLADEIYPEARELVNAHLECGHTIAIVSAATPYQVMPIARDLGIEHIMCTKLEVEKGSFTGNIIEPTCWGNGKAFYAQQLADEHGLDLDKSYFYTDSIEDLPLLEIVGNPRPMNPDAELSKFAYKNGWPIYHFQSKPKIGVSNLVRTFMAAGSMFPAILNGIYKTGTTLSSNTGVNSMWAAFADLAISMAGVHLAIRGEEYLDTRPAVFIMNHQSNADPLIAAKLLRKDVVAIAKKEVKNYPIVGQMASAAGVIFIDRSNKEKSIEAMKPAVDALKSGKSIMIWPEGTRSKTYDLLPFKKGAFHLAMQAKAPIVPIVVRNSHDILPRGGFLLQPAVVQLEVLPPISTKRWKRDKLDAKIEEIRNQFLEKLGQ